MMAARREASAPPEIAGYEYTRVLGLGGFADVFLYQQLLPRRPVAVKVLLASSLDVESRRRFQAEANVMAQLSHHPSIVTIHQADIAPDGRPYLVMEYCSRPGLGARYRTERIAVAEALRIGVRLAAAVETAHRAGILHRDIKPANVLTTDFGWPALTDFGIAETVGLAAGSSIGMSIPWSPPELLAEIPTGDARGDVYSLAATIYSLLARRSPFEVPDGSNSAAELVARIERWPLPSTGRGDVPDSLHAILARAMEKDPAQRYPTALAVARALVEVEEELHLPVTAIDVEDDVPPPAATVSDVLPPHGFREASQATRVRPLVNVEPGPVEPGPVESGPVESSTVEPRTVAEATVVRPIGVVRAPPPTPVGADRSPTPGPAYAARSVQVDDPAIVDPTTLPRSPVVAGGRARNPHLWTGIAAGVVVAGALVAISIAVFGPRHDAVRPAPGDPAASPSTVVVATVPSPTGLQGTRAADGSVVFRWTDPAPEAGDRFLWGVRRASAAPSLSLISDPTVTVAVADQPPVAAGATRPEVCVEVSIVRVDGRASTAPAVGCVP